MKTKIKYILRLLVVAVLLFEVAEPVAAQSRANNRKGKKEKTTSSQSAQIVKLKAIILDEEGKPVQNVVLFSGENTPMVRIGDSGMLAFQAKSDTRLVFEAPGYEPYAINLAAEAFPPKIIMKKVRPFSSAENIIHRTDGGNTTLHDLTGAAGSISGESLRSYPDLMLGNALQGRAAGLYVSPTLGKVGNNGPSLFLRGQHAKSSNQAIVMVDGVERPLDELIAEEIESIQLLKDPVTKILYGPRAANGVIQVTTRRGQSIRRSINISAEAGVAQLTRMPEYIDAYQYAQLYNEARQNDGLPPFYSQAQLEGYRNSTGPNDLLYPNADYFDEFVKKQALFRKATVELIGGNEAIRYALIMGYAGSGGYEKMGPATNFDRLNIRGSIDVKINNYLSIAGGIATRIDMMDWGSQTPADYYPLLNSQRPNEYPFTIAPEAIGMVPDDDGFPAFGASLYKINNLYADMMYGGFSHERNLNSQADLGVNLNLDKVTKGLTASARISFDNYNYFMNGQRNVHATYAVIPYLDQAGEEQLQVIQMRKYVPQSDQSRLGEKTLRTIAWGATAGYDRSFGKHDVGAALAYNYYKNEVKGKSLDIINSNTTLRFNYGFDNRLLLEATLACMGSNRFGSGNKFFFSPAVGGAWILSNEQFLQGNTQINFLKLKASFGILGYDGSTGTRLYATGWDNGGDLALGEQNKTSGEIVTTFLRVGNPDLKWERSTEWNVGLEGLFLQERLFAEVNYFHEERSNIIGYNGAEYGNYLGVFHGNSNMGRVMNQGVEATIRWNQQIGDFGYMIGVNGMWSRNELLEWNQINYPDTYLNMIGKPTDAMMGYRALGLFGRDVAIASHPTQYLGPYQEGDIAYADLNGDGQIDDRDRAMIGNSFPRLNLGIELNLRYKQWSLYMLGVAETGVDVWTNNNYYWNRQEDKYSVLAADRYHPVNNPTGSYPRLTTYAGTNNFQNSSFWMENADFFRLKNVELSYTWDNRKAVALCRQIKVFARASNVFVLSGIKDLDPELINAGVENYPLIRAITAGITVKF